MIICGFISSFRQCRRDIKKRGRTYTAISAAGKDYEKDNPSVKNALLYNRQMVAILAALGLSTETVVPPDAGKDAEKDMTSMICKEIDEYIAQVRHGAVPVCKDQLRLCDYVEKCFAMERHSCRRIAASSGISTSRSFSRSGCCRGKSSCLHFTIAHTGPTDYSAGLFYLSWSAAAQGRTAICPLSRLTGSRRSTA